MKTLTPVMVDYIPDPKLTNGFIKAMQSRIGGNADAQELATEWASYVAAVAFTLCGSNPPDRVALLMEAIVSDALGQFKAHKAAVAARSNTHPAPVSSQ